MYRARGGVSLNSALMALRARPMLHASRTSESEKRKDTVAASNHSPMTMAPNTAMVISRFMSARRKTSPVKSILT